MLISNGANLAAMDSYAQTPLLLAIKSTQVELAKTLIQNGAMCQANTLLHAASESEDTTMAKTLLQAGTFVDAKDKVNE